VKDGADESNDQGLVQGQLDIPLNNHGRSQIEKLARHCELVPFNRIYTSNLSRAVEVRQLPSLWDGETRIAGGGHTDG
jgi:broad specificity phosphatase PhoE